MKKLIITHLNIVASITTVIIGASSLIAWVRGYMSIEQIVAILGFFILATLLIYLYRKYQDSLDSYDELKEKQTKLQNKIDKLEGDVATYKDKVNNCKEELRNEKSNFDKELAKAQEIASNYEMLYKMEENAHKKLEEEHKELEEKFKKLKDKNDILNGQLTGKYLPKTELSPPMNLTYTDVELKKLTVEETLALMEEKRKQGTLNYDDSIKAIEILKSKI